MKIYSDNIDSIESKIQILALSKDNPLKDNTKSNFSIDMCECCIDCSNKRIVALEVSEFKTLSSLKCSINRLEKLDVSMNISLQELSCAYNLLTEINLQYNIILSLLYCSGNNLYCLDVSSNTLLEVIDCSYNKLKSLTLTNHKKIRELYCNGNRISSLILSGCANINTIYCFDNDLNGDNMTLFVQSLPVVSNGRLYIINNSVGSIDKNHATYSDIEIANIKGWEILNSDGDTYYGDEV